MVEVNKWMAHPLLLIALCPLGNQETVQKTSDLTVREGESE